MKTILVAGLGNPGKKYEKTRHNAGFMFVDYFWESHHEEFGLSDWEFNKKFNTDTSTGKIGAKKIILLKPQTFMNLSGEAVKKALDFYKLLPSDLIVVHDEIDLPLETFRISVDSSSAGHQGAQNIIDELGTKDFTRLRIGIENREDKKIETEKYVLGKFKKDELEKIKIVNNDLCKQILAN
jgi:peptidyl-tRNA hydrolase, PTH1 family